MDRSVLPISRGDPHGQEHDPNLAPATHHQFPHQCPQPDYTCMSTHRWSFLFHVSFSSIFLLNCHYALHPLYLDNHTIPRLSHWLFRFFSYCFHSSIANPHSYSLPPPPYIWMAIPRSPVPTTLLFLYIAVSDPGHFFSIQGCIYRLFPFRYLLSQQNNVPFNAGWEML